MRSLRSIALALLMTACGPTLPPTTVPPATTPELESFRSALQAYIELTQPYRRVAAEAAERVPGQTGTSPNAETAVRTREMSLADQLLATLRPQARQGDLFVPTADAIIRHDVMTVFGGPMRELLMDALAEENEEGADSSPTAPLAINQKVDAPGVPPLLLESLPPLPKQLEYALVGRALILRDVDARLVADFLPDALPESPPADVPAAAAAPPPTQAPAPLPMPEIKGGTIFAVIGDSGSGDAPQEMVANAMSSYFASGRRFPIVLMLGDNLYHDDYTGEFLMPYKPLLDRGVNFYAALGNHDSALQRYFKPFHMQDRDYYAFDQGNIRFVALNSNRPRDPAQEAWLDKVFADAGTKWRITFFHHPLYSSGEHARESREVIRPALEPMLIRNRIDIAFSGHEHLYERVAPQNGVRYFVSGGGGRNLYAVRPSAFDESAVSEHHFMVVQITGDRLLYEAITPDNQVLDCGILYRTAEAQGKAQDPEVAGWLETCGGVLRQLQSARR